MFSAPLILGEKALGECADAYRVGGIERNILLIDILDANAAGPPLGETLK